MVLDFSGFIKKIDISMGNARLGFLSIIVFIMLIGCRHPGMTEAAKKDTIPDRIKYYTNPLNISISDPYILKAPDGKYYMTGTDNEGDSSVFRAYSSSNLIDWVDAGNLLYRDPEASWAKGSFRAPELYYINKRYYLFYSAQWRNNPAIETENLRIGVAVSDKPGGPYHDILNQPVFDPGYPVIDANILVDNDGHIYLYYSRSCYKNPVESELADWAKSLRMYNEIDESWIYGVELKSDCSGIIGEPVLLLRPPVSFFEKDDSWESRSVVNHEVNKRLIEAPASFKNGDTYYIMYSANSSSGTSYGIGYATSLNPLGPFEKAKNNPVTETKGDVISPGNNCVVKSPDGTEMYCVYSGKSMRASIDDATAPGPALSGRPVRIIGPARTFRSARPSRPGQSSAVSGQPVAQGYTGQNLPSVYFQNMKRTLYIDKMEFSSDGKLLVNCGETLPQPYPSDRVK